MHAGADLCTWIMVKYLVCANMLLSGVPAVQCVHVYVGTSTLIRTLKFCIGGSFGKSYDLGCNSLPPVEGIQQLHPKFARLAFLPLPSTQSK